MYGYGYFANGGGIAYVVRVGGEAGQGQADGAGQGPKELTDGEPVGLGSFRVSALPDVDASRTTVEVSHPERENAEGNPQRKTPSRTPLGLS